MKNIEKQKIKEVLERLDKLPKISDKDKMVLRYRFGLIDGKIHTLRETGELFKLTRERIRQIQDRAIKKIEGSDLIS